ncbi:MAG: site-specific DNA-methyltransferase [Actinomycetes bacterium]
MTANQPVFRSPLGTLFHGDCMDVLATIDDASVDLVFADPPFNLGKFYAKNVNDQLEADDYVDWCRQWIKECDRVLKPGGSFFLYNLPKWNIQLGSYMSSIGLQFRHWIAIDIKLGLPITGRLYPAHYSLLYYSAGKPKTFLRPRIPIAVCRHCGKDIKDYGGHRNKLNPNGINVSDVWTDIPPVRHRSTKSRGANQLSPKLLRRVLEISTNEGDLVFDPFGGSGTTYAVAEEMHRHWIGCEVGDVGPIIERLSGQTPSFEMPNRGDSGKGWRASSKPEPSHPFLWES